MQSIVTATLLCSTWLHGRIPLPLLSQLICGLIISQKSVLSPYVKFFQILFYSYREFFLKKVFCLIHWPSFQPLFWGPWRGPMRWAIPCRDSILRCELHCRHILLLFNWILIPFSFSFSTHITLGFYNHNSWLILNHGPSIAWKTSGKRKLTDWKFMCLESKRKGLCCTFSFDFISLVV